MTTFNLTCEAVEATLADYLDETLEPWVRTAIEEHLVGCARCTALAYELRNIARETAALPALLPERDVWPKVAARIGAPAIFSEPVEESAPLAPVPERVVFASDTFLPISEEPGAPEEPLVLTTDSPVITTDLPPLTSEPVLTKEPAVPTKEAPALTKEPPVLKTEAASVTHELPLPTRGPLTLASEPALRSRTAPMTTTAAAHALAARREKRWGPLQIALAAAALVLVTATTSSLLTVRLLGRAGTPSVASTAGAGKASSSEKPPAERRIRGQSTDREPVEPDLSTPTPAVASALTVSAAASPTFTPSPEEIVYDKEINTLSRIVRRKKSGLDPSTVTVIDKNLRAVDSAIAQIRAALQDDPSNSLLDAQASRALEMKVELLRRAAMMRSSSSL
jgi:hypothetical protein